MTADQCDKDLRQDGAACGEDDLAGWTRLTDNVVASWVGQLAFVITGFVLPRVIDRQLGQAALGVWDFGWSLVAYFALVEGGISSSVNRYVAKHRAAGDTEGLNHVVSSATCILVLVAALVVGLTVATAWVVPPLLRERLGEFVTAARWLIVLFGMSMAIRVAFSGYGGVLTGCHRWDLHNGIHASTRIVAAIGMITASQLGGGLPVLAGINLCAGAGGWLLRCVLAYRLCPELEIRPRHVCWEATRRMLVFGGKSLIPHIAELLANQTVSILIMAFLGPAALAVYARPKSIVRHARTFVAKFSFVMTPTASSLQATGRQRRLKELLVKSTRYGLYFSLPLVLLLAIMGDPLMRLWMGDRYAHRWILTILALGHLTYLVQLPVVSIMAGLDAHGRPAVATLLASVAGVGVTVLSLMLWKWGLVGVALAVTVPLTLTSALYTPVLACRRIRVPVGRYLVECLRGPILCAIPYAALLVAARLIFSAKPMLALAMGVAVSGAVLAVLYWGYALPPSLKRRIARRLRLKGTWGTDEA